MKLILFLSLVLAFVLGIGYGNNEGVDYDYFHLVLQWPESFCNTGEVTCYDHRPNWFIIHGMWPQKNGYKVSCPKISKISNKARYFKLEKLDVKLIASMDYCWPSLKVKNPNSKPFWSHEWSAHGSCTSFTQAEYFQKVVSIAAKLPLSEKLSSAGIRPDMETNSWEIKYAIEKAFKLTPQIRCNTDQFNEFQLYEIIFCVDKTGTKLQNCNYKAIKCDREPFQFPKNQ